MRFLRQSLIGLVLASLTLGLLAVAAMLVGQAMQARLAGDDAPVRQRERVIAVSVVTARQGVETPVIEAFGQVQSRRSLEIRAAAPGRIVDLSENFLDGGTVEAGDVLARIDDQDARAALERVRSDLADAEAEVRDAKKALELARDDLAAAREQADLRERAYRRQADLLDRGVGTAAAVEVAELAASSARQAVVSRRQAVAAAEARVSQASTRLARSTIALSEAERRLDDTVIVAAFSGALSEVSVVEGGLVAQNEQLARLIDPDALEVAFRVSTAQYARLLDDGGRLRPAPIVATLDVFGTNLTAPGRITRAQADVRDGQSGRLIYASLDKPRGLKPGDFVGVEVEEPALVDVVRLPAAALDADNTVLVLAEDDRLESLPVSLLRRQRDDVLVRGVGLDGREVVAQRAPILGPGVKVRALRGAEAGSLDAPDLVELSAERRARLVAFVEGNNRMPAEAKTRILNALAQARVPARMVERIESRMGG